MRTWIGLVALIASACTDPDAGAEGPPVYLALGDSVAFGFDPLVDMRAVQVAGYAEMVSDRRGIEVVNASCPGEATGGFVSPVGTDNGCRENRSDYPLHVAYEGTQLGFALDFLRANPNTTLVTIDIGANDIGKLKKVCVGELGCILAGFVPMIEEYSRNLDWIFGEIRRVYDGPLVALSIYNPFPEDPTAQFGLDRINAVLAERIEKFDGALADGMETFRAASNNDPCGGGLLIAMPDGTCDVHPSPAGDQLLANAIEMALAAH